MWPAKERPKADAGEAPQWVGGLLFPSWDYRFRLCGVGRSGLCMFSAAMVCQVRVSGVHILSLLAVGFVSNVRCHAGPWTLFANVVLFGRSCRRMDVGGMNCTV